MHVSLAPWVPFFSATATAAAALVGLIIVAMSVNVKAIVAIPTMPSRASSTIANVMVVLIVSVVALVPVVGLAGLGVVLVLATLLAGVLAGDAAVRLIRSRGDDASSPGRVSAIARGLLGIVPLVASLIAGIMLLVADGGGLVALAVAIVLIFIESVINAWVLMIEIRR